MMKIYFVIVEYFSDFGLINKLFVIEVVVNVEVVKLVNIMLKDMEWKLNVLFEIWEERLFCL